MIILNIEILIFNFQHSRLLIRRGQYALYLFHVIDLFAEEGISGEVLNMLDEEQLEKIGIR